MGSENNLSLSPQEETLPEYVKRIRVLRGLSKAEFARRAGVHVSSVLRLEAGRIAGIRMRGQVQGRLASALQIPVEYLKAACRGDRYVIPPTGNVCPHCWVPGTPPDPRWSLVDAKYCLRCGASLRNSCARCDEAILLSGRFCPQCGHAYKSD